MTLNEYLIKKANAYHGADGRFTTINNAVITTKPKEHHSDAVKNTFKTARSIQAQRKLNKRNATKLGKIEEIMFYGVDQSGGKYVSNEKIDSFIKQRTERIKNTQDKYDIERLKRANKRDQKTKRLNAKNPYAINYFNKTKGIETPNSFLVTQKSELLSTLATIYRVKKANPYKDESGKWTSKEKAKSIAEWFYEGGKEQIKRTSAGLAGAVVGGLAGAGAGSLAGSGLAAAGSSYLAGAAGGLTSIPLLGESLSGLAKASAPAVAGLATGAALGSMTGLGVLGIGAGAYLGAKTAGAAVGGYLGAKGGYEVGTALYDSNLSEKIEEWKSNAKDKASAQTDKLKDTVKARVGDLKNKASKEFDDAKQKAHAAIESKAAQAKELIKQKANEVKNKAKAAATSKLKELTARYKPIKKHDLTALKNA